MLTTNIIRKIMPYCPKSRADLYVPLLNEICPKYGINTELRMASFLATLAVESGELRYTKEIANGWAYDISKNPKKAKALGNLAFGDGPKYKGHGLIQITGKNNHKACTEAFGKAHGVDFVLFPEKLAEPRWAVESACWFWQSHGLNELADHNQFRTIQSIVNRGTPDWRNKPALHLQQRLDYYAKAIASIPDDFGYSENSFGPLTLIDKGEEVEEEFDLTEPTVMSEPVFTEEPYIEQPAYEEPAIEPEPAAPATTTTVVGEGATTVATGQTNGTPAVVAENVEEVKVEPNVTPVPGGGAADTPVEMTKERPSFQTMVQSALAWILSVGAGLVGAFKLFFESIDQVPTINIVVICGAVLGLAFLGYKIYNDSAERANRLNLAKMQHLADPSQINVELKQS